MGARDERLPAASQPTVAITRKGADRIAAGHPWIYRSDLAREPALPGGEVVRVVDGRGWFQGQAFYSSKSKIALRMLTREDEPCDREFFRRRVALARQMRETAFPFVNAWRAIHGEADLLPGLVVDRYEDYLTVQFLAQGSEARRELFADVLMEVFEPKAIIDRSDAKVRLLEGLPQTRGILRGAAPEGPVRYLEGAVSLEVDLVGGQKTGAFLDQRENHLAVRQYAHGIGLDCFSYVGGFALQMADGCERVTAVEISDAAGGQIRRNAELNGIDNVDVVVANAFDLLKEKSETDERYDIIVLDPPAFAKSKAAVPAAMRGYKEINLRALQLLKPGGYLVSASCSFHITEEQFEEVLAAAANDARRNVQIVEKRGAGRDHPVIMNLRETRYLKCYVLRVL